MSRDSPQHLPSELREHVEQEDDEPLPLGDLWSLLASAKPSTDELPEASDTWTAVEKHIDAGTEVSGETDRRAADRSRRTPPGRTANRRAAWRWGGSLAVLVVAALGVWFWMRPVVVTAPPGQMVTRTLPDGSVAELHGGTRLTYARSFSTVSLLEADRRRIRLEEGEAYFEVDPAERPFVVTTQTARVEAVGTAFSVQRWAQDGPDTHVALAAGRVRVQGASDTSRAVTLQPGQAIRVGAKGPEGAPADTTIQRVTAWRQGGFAVTAQPLPEIVQALERRFGTPIALTDAIPERVRNKPLTLYYADDVTLTSILHDVCMARDLSYRATQTGYVLEPKATSPTPSGSSR